MGKLFFPALRNDCGLLSARRCEESNTEMQHKKSSANGLVCEF